jgi:hypothetical protein
MEWFRKHLNWTVVITTVSAWVFAWILVEVALMLTGMDYIPYPGDPYIKNIPGVNIEFFLTFTIQAVIDVAVLVSIPMFYYILKSKKRRRLYLLLFVLPLIPVPHPVFVIIFLMPFWLLGWIILLLSNNKLGSVC